MEIGFIKVEEKVLHQFQRRVRMLEWHLYGKNTSNISKFMKINPLVSFVRKLFYFPYEINIQQNNIFSKDLRIFKGWLPGRRIWST